MDYLLMRRSSESQGKGLKYKCRILLKYNILAINIRSIGSSWIASMGVTFLPCTSLGFRFLLRLYLTVALPCRLCYTIKGKSEKRWGKKKGGRFCLCLQHFIVSQLPPITHLKPLLWRLRGRSNLPYSSTLRRP